MKSKEVIVVAGVTLLLLVFIEGLASFTIAAYEIAHPPPSAEATRFDQALGWSGKPNFFSADYYGPGKYVRTDSMGFRADRETLQSVPDGKIRVICSGDSFTYGQGVANDKTWCHRLTELDGRITSLNMGQPGYGVDQMYLRYMRDGIGLEHSILIFAFVDGDLNRMSGREKDGYGKPVLRLMGGNIVADGVPVSYFRWKLARSLRRADFRFFDLAQRVLRRFARNNSDSSIERVEGIAAAVFLDIQELGMENNVVPLYIYLPTQRDISADSRWRLWTEDTMASLGLNFIDFTPALREIPAGKAASFFVAEHDAAAGHYTDEGNDWVAGKILEVLTSDPRMSSYLGESTDDR